MKKLVKKRLSDIKNEFERGIFSSVYQSRKQKLNRVSALILLIIKHALRGALFSWPLYMFALAAFLLPEVPILIAALLVVPAIYVSWMILSRGVREDYDNLVDGYILRSGYLGRLLFHSKP